MTNTQTLSLVKYETVTEVPVGSWTFMRQYLRPNDDETFTVNKEEIDTLESDCTEEEKEQYKELIKTLRELCEMYGECYIAIT